MGVNRILCVHLKFQNGGNTLLVDENDHDIRLIYYLVRLTLSCKRLVISLARLLVQQITTQLGSMHLLSWDCAGLKWHRSQRKTVVSLEGQLLNIFRFLEGELMQEM